MHPHPGWATLLTPAEVERTHQASLTVLARTGLLVLHAGARDLLVGHGSTVWCDAKIIPIGMAQQG